MRPLDDNRTIDLSNIPIYYRGKTPHYDWNKAKGVECKFKIGQDEGIITILDTYKKQYKNSYRIYLIVQYQDDVYDITCDSLLKCNLSNLIYKHKLPFKYEIGQHIINENEDYTILNREYRNYRDKKGNTTKRYYYTRCNKCGKETWREEGWIKGNSGCSVCKGIETLQGYNDIPTIAPWMIKYFPGGEEEAKLYSPSSNKKIDFICPDCGRVKKYYIYNLYGKHKLPCVCQDGISYPNKFMYSFFEQLGLNFTIEKSFNWSNGRIYDDYVELEDNVTLICENHGGFHYEENNYKNAKITLQDQQAIDKEKREIAIHNGITYYIELDCRNSDKDWIKNSIENSILSELFDISKIDFNQCDVFATKNLTKIICDYKCKHPESFAPDIADSFNIGVSAVRKYLKKGQKLGWCEYDSSTEKARRAKFLIHKRNDAKPIHCIELDKYYHDTGLFIDCFNLENSNINFRYWSILRVCHGQLESYNNFHFRFISREYFNKMKSESPEKVVGEYFKIA